MTKYDWLLLIHILGAFLLFSGSITAGVLHLAAARRDRPSEVALLLGLIQPAVVAIVLGSIVTLGLGIWLAEDAGYGVGDEWVIAAIVLLVIGNIVGAAGGKPLERAGEMAQRLAADGDRPSEELRRAVRDARGVVLSYLSFTALIAILVLMVFKPGAG